MTRSPKKIEAETLIRLILDVILVIELIILCMVFVAVFWVF